MSLLLSHLYACMHIIYMYDPPPNFDTNPRSKKKHKTLENTGQPHQTRVHGGGGYHIYIYIYIMQRYYLCRDTIYAYHLIISYLYLSVYIYIHSAHHSQFEVTYRIGMCAVSIQDALVEMMNWRVGGFNKSEVTLRALGP